VKSPRNKNTNSKRTPGIQRSDPSPRSSLYPHRYQQRQRDSSAYGIHRRNTTEWNWNPTQSKNGGRELARRLTESPPAAGEPRNATAGGDSRRIPEASTETRNKKGLLWREEDKHGQRKEEERWRRTIGGERDDEEERETGKGKKREVGWWAPGPERVLFCAFGGRSVIGGQDKGALGSVPRARPFAKWRAGPDSRSAPRASSSPVSVSRVIIFVFRILSMTGGV
jgi:hypothetical protein